MSYRIFIGSPIIDHEGQIMQVCKHVLDRNPQWRIVQPDSWHVTYAFPGEVDEHRFMEAQDIVRLIAQEFEPFQLEAERFVFMQTRDPRMLWLKMKLNERFEALFHRFHEELQIKPSHPPNPHVTIMRGNPKNLLEKSLPQFEFSRSNQLLTGVNLYRSFLQPGGSRYEVVNSGK